MLRKKGLLISVALAVIVGALLLWIVTGRDSRPAPVSSLAFEEIRRHVGSAYTGPQVRQVSRRMAGTRVRWTGTVVDISRKGIVRVAVGDSSSANAEFQALRQADPSFARRGRDCSCGNHRGDRCSGNVPPHAPSLRLPAGGPLGVSHGGDAGILSL